MKNIKNNHIVEVVEKILDFPGDTMPLDLAEELMDYLADATLICLDNGDGGIMFLQLGSNVFLPACCDIDNFKKYLKIKLLFPIILKIFQDLLVMWMG